jgi:hypothetical protein
MPPLPPPSFSDLEVVWKPLRKAGSTEELAARRDIFGSWCYNFKNYLTDLGAKWMAIQLVQLKSMSAYGCPMQVREALNIDQ